MLYEIEVLEIRDIADLALSARKCQNRLLERAPDIELGEPSPARGEHNPNASLALTDIPGTRQEFVELQQAIERLPPEILQKVWAVARVGRGDITIREWNDTLASAALLKDDDIVMDLMADPDLHEHLRKGLYALGATHVPGDDS
ncbi:MAG TPA: DUF3775 domain-containing protein [Rhodopila sp.]|uniref:DUF3775 domain-containing protein n=1 Tax=Rhodopila sp. TaxID=2480087 RepID=UPI002C16BBB0|nr:DUF3775 domain-containing protein [Rhodopila sp.]HVY14116.1 DUF3775 domain-containing protein [Rhodopila sp.]